MKSAIRKHRKILRETYLPFAQIIGEITKIVNAVKTVRKEVYTVKTTVCNNRMIFRKIYILTIYTNYRWNYQNSKSGNNITENGGNSRIEIILLNIQREQNTNVQSQHRDFSLFEPQTRFATIERYFAKLTYIYTTYRRIAKIVKTVRTSQKDV